MAMSPPWMAASSALEITPCLRYIAACARDPARSWAAWRLYRVVTLFASRPSMAAEKLRSEAEAKANEIAARNFARRDAAKLFKLDIDRRKLAKVA